MTLESLILIKIKLELIPGISEIDRIKKITIFIENLSGHSIELLETFNPGLELELGHGSERVNSWSWGHGVNRFPR